jgi:hypothetical protein
VAVILLKGQDDWNLYVTGGDLGSLCYAHRFLGVMIDDMIKGEASTVLLPDGA